jgi:hypothetical protein
MRVPSDLFGFGAVEKSMLRLDHELDDPMSLRMTSFSRFHF